jgi:hypothetical protein
MAISAREHVPLQHRRQNVVVSCLHIGPERYGQLLPLLQYLVIHRIHTKRWIFTGSRPGSILLSHCLP